MPKEIFGKEPAVVIGIVASVIVAVLAIFHIIIDVDTVTGIITALAPLVAALITRAHVSPANPGV